MYLALCSPALDLVCGPFTGHAADPEDRPVDPKTLVNSRDCLVESDDESSDHDDWVIADASPTGTGGPGGARVELARRTDSTFPFPSTKIELEQHEKFVADRGEQQLHALEPVEAKVADGDEDKAGGRAAEADQAAESDGGAEEEVHKKPSRNRSLRSLSDGQTGPQGKTVDEEVNRQGGPTSTHVISPTPNLRKPGPRKTSYRLFATKAHRPHAYRPDVLAYRRPEKMKPAKEVAKLVKIKAAPAMAVAKSRAIAAKARVRKKKEALKSRGCCASWRPAPALATGSGAQPRHHSASAVSVSVPGTAAVHNAHHMREVARLDAENTAAIKLLHEQHDAAVAEHNLVLDTAVAEHNLVLAALQKEHEVAIGKHQKEQEAVRLALSRELAEMRTESVTEMEARNAQKEAEGHATLEAAMGAHNSALMDHAKARDELSLVGTDSAEVDHDAEHTMLVTCPTDAMAGYLLDVITPNGHEVEVKVPQGVGPGDEFEVSYDDRQLAAQDP
eukprot:SAG11_NODE_4_length_33019_cov_28.098909_4_plen_504_part_00